MVRVLSLITFTDQGVRNIKDSIARAGSFGQEVESAGGKLISQFWSVGDIDGCVTFEARDPDTATALLLGLAKDGNVRTRTVKLYNTGEFEQVLAKL